MDESFLFQTSEEQCQTLVVAGRPLKDLVGEAQRLYLEDSRPWVIGYSGGKDSTAILQIIFLALLATPKENRHKPVYVVSSDTLVETPLVVNLVKGALIELNEKALDLDIPLTAHQVFPKSNDGFWANLLGKGYPAPTQTFRWCTERMKINPVSSFILEKVAEHGEVVVVLGSRRQESASRAQVIAKHKIDGSSLARHTSLPNAYVYMPIEDWSADDVWEFLMSAPRPWGGTNRELLELYKGSNAGECPIVIDTSTPSCGNSRFGCWTCTVVTTDKAMESLVEQGEDWMLPLLEFRNLLAETTVPANKEIYRNYKRRTGKISFAKGDIQDDSDESATRKHIPGPYWLSYRKEWLTKLLQIEKSINEGGHAVELITEDELHAIRAEWLIDPNEPDWSDSLPEIYESVYGRSLEWRDSGLGSFAGEDAELLTELGSRHGIDGRMLQKLMELEISMDGLAKRQKMTARIETILKQDWETLEENLAKDHVAFDGGYSDEQAALTDEMQAFEKNVEANL